MKINYLSIKKYLKEQIPESILTNKHSKYLIQYVDDEGLLPEVLYHILDNALFDVIPNSKSIMVKCADSKRCNNIFTHQIYVIDPNRLKLAFTIGNLNKQRAFNWVVAQGKWPGHIVDVNPKTSTVLKTLKDFSEIEIVFDYWGNTKFDVIISFDPQNVEQLLKENGIVVKL